MSTLNIQKKYSAKMEKNPISKKDYAGELIERLPELPPAPKPESLLDIESVFKLIDLYFKQKNIMYSHLHNSFDKFLDEDVKSLLRTGRNVFFEKITRDKVYRYMFEYEDIAVKPPTDNDDEMMFPINARTRNMTYSARLVATITQVQEVIDVATKEVTRNIIGQPEYEYPIAIIPIMVRSKYCSLNIKRGENKSECKYDPGGYFIINGSEKVVMSLERMVDNKPLVFTKKDSNALIYSVQCNSKSNIESNMTQIISIRMKKDKLMTIRVPILNEIPVFILFRALGVESDKAIINTIAYDSSDTDMINLIRISLENSVFEGTDRKIRTKEEAINYLIQKMRVVKRYNETDKDIRLAEKKIHLESLILNNFIPHIEADPLKKAYFMGYMINRLLQVFLGRLPKDDRDSYVNKRVDLPGTLIFELFKQYYKKMLNECSKFFRRRNNDDEKPLNIINQIKPNIIEQGLKSALSTGAWGSRKGVAQMLQRLTYLQTISSLRRINSPTVDASTNKLTSPRHLHNTQLSGICVTGDTEILLGDGISLKRIDQITELDRVMTVNSVTLKTESSKIYNYFEKIPETLLKITTISGRTLKCTHDHPLLIKMSDGKYEMVKVGELKKGQQVVINESTNENINVNGVSPVEIEHIEEILCEKVYDFTTISDNHSFIGNGFVMSNCYIETPEGHKVGLVKNLALMGNVTLGKKNQSYVVKDFLMDKLIDIHDIGPGDLMKMTKVFLNGEWLGMTLQSRKLYNALKQMKINGDLDAHTSVIHNIKSEIESKEIKIFCDGGRIFRPYYVVNNNVLAVTKQSIDTIILKGKSNATSSATWNEFLLKNPGSVEYLDTDEMVNSMVAMFPKDVEKMRKRQFDSSKVISNIDVKNNNTIVNRYDEFVYVKYTHCELHPSMMIGAVVANIPFSNHNQAPRNIFQYSHAKQAMGIYASNYRDRLDISYILYNSQRPIITTRLTKYIGTDRLPAGENIVVAIACYTGL
jgi:DNA-directed RNA polymerase beta subunit